MATHIIDKARKYLDIIVNILQDELEVISLKFSGTFDLLEFYEQKSLRFLKEKVLFQTQNNDFYIYISDDFDQQALGLPYIFCCPAFQCTRSKKSSL